jgi:hypothetical protein
MYGSSSFDEESFRYINGTNIKTGGDCVALNLRHIGFSLTSCPELNIHVNCNFDKYDRLVKDSFTNSHD